MSFPQGNWPPPLPPPPPPPPGDESQGQGTSHAVIQLPHDSSAADQAAQTVAAENKQSGSVAKIDGLSGAVRDFMPVAGSTSDNSRVVDRSNYNYSTELKHDGVQHKEEYSFNVQGESGSNGRKQEWFEKKSG